MSTTRETIRTYRRRQFGLISLILLVGSCAFILMHWIANQGPGVSPDSTVYIEAARSLRAGNGFLVQGEAMTHYPPGYPLLVAMVDWLHPGDVLQATRFLAALFFAANLVLLSLAVYLCTRHNLPATGCAVLIFLFSAPTIAIHSMAWSEAPFIAFSMTSLLLLSYYIARHSRYLLVLASLMAGFAAGTRYVGVVLFPTMALAFLLLDYRSLKLKMRDMIIFTGIASLPLVAWFIRNIRIAQSTTDREFAFHPAGLNHMKELMITIHDFFLPVSGSTWIKAIHVGMAVTLFLFGLAILYRKRWIKENPASIGVILPGICVIYFLVYIVFLIVSISFFDANTPFESRILLPAILALTLSGITLAWSLSEALGQRWIWYGFLLLALSSVGINGEPAIAKALNIHKYGSGYTSRYWKQSKIIAYLSASTDVRTIYSNRPEGIRFLTGKRAVMIPAKVSPVTRSVNVDYEEELKQMIQKCREGKALIVHFNGVTSRWYLPSIEEVESMGRLPILSRIEEGVIYGTR
jgi:hypothetical protein